MKKFKFSLLAVLSLTLITSCNEKIETPKNDFIKAFLKDAQVSFTLKAQEQESVYKKDDSLMFTNKYNYDINMVTSGATPAIKESLRVESINGNSTSSFKYVKDKDGFVAKEALDYKNEIFYNQVRDDNSAKINYDQQYSNPFLLLNVNDFELKDGVYSLNKRKTQLFSYKLLGLSYEISDVLFNFEGEALSNITIKATDSNIQYQDAYTGDYIPAILRYTTTVYLSDLGKTSYDHLEVAKSRDKEREDTLTKALEPLKAGNYTMIINEHYQGEKGDSKYDSYWFYDGSNAVYHQQHVGFPDRNYDLYYKKDESRSKDLLYYFDFNKDTGKWEYNEPVYSQSYNNDPKPYSYFISKAGDTSPYLFSYDEATSTYVCDNEYAIGFLGNAMLPGSYPIRDFTNGAGNLAKIKLTSDNKIDTITVGYYYVDDQGYDLSREYVIRFVNVGTTVIPDWVEA